MFNFNEGINVSELNYSSFNNIYKLDATDPLKYKWSLLSSWNDSLSDIPSPTRSPSPIKTDVSESSSTTSFNSFRLKTCWIVAIVVIVVLVFICTVG